MTDKNRYYEVMDLNLSELNKSSANAEVSATQKTYIALRKMIVIGDIKPGVSLPL